MCLFFPVVPLKSNSCVNWSCFDTSHVKVPGSGEPSESRPNELSNLRYAVFDWNFIEFVMSQSTSTCMPLWVRLFWFGVIRPVNGSWPKR